MKVLAVLQARMSSSRLPGKVLREILGRPMLARQIERLLQAQTLDELVVATSETEEDDAIDALCRELGVRCFRGSLDDVLDRFYQCALNDNPDHVVRLTGDCPLADPGIIDRVVRSHLDGNYDYTSNVLPPTWPDGMDVEVMRFKCLLDANAEAALASEREHVTPFIYNHPERYRLGNVAQKNDQSAHRLTVDEPEDLEKVRRIYEVLYPLNPEFGLDDVISLMKADGELMNLNSHIVRNEGLHLSEQKDVDSDVRK